MKKFNLIDYKQKARESSSLTELFCLWDSVSSYYELGYIDNDELDQMKAIIWPNLKTISAIKRQIDQVMQPG